MLAANGHDGTMVARACLAVVAVLAAAWLALSLRNDQLALKGLKKTIVGASTPAGPGRDRVIEGGIRDLREASLLNPDKTPAIYAALVESTTDREAATQRLVELSRSYPKDALVWAAIARALPSSDPRASEARARLRLLIPQRPR